MQYTIRYMRKVNIIRIQNKKSKTGVDLTTINNVGDGMAQFLIELVAQANKNEVTHAHEIEHQDAPTIPLSVLAEQEIRRRQAQETD